MLPATRDPRTDACADVLARQVGASAVCHFVGALCPGGMLPARADVLDEGTSAPFPAMPKWTHTQGEVVGPPKDEEFPDPSD